MTESNNKQLVAFLDLLGFRHYYDIIARQNKIDSKKFASLAVGQLYRAYMRRLRDAVKKSFTQIAESLPENSATFDEHFLSSMLNPNILAISDSIIVAIDCNEQQVIPAYMALANSLLLLTDETMKSDYMSEDLKKYNLSMFCPIRGAITYDYAELDFNDKDPMLYGMAYYKAYKLEGQAGWPRIVIEKELASILMNSSFCANSLSAISENQDFSAYFDPLKMKYTHIIKKISNIDGQQALIRDFATLYKKYIELNARQASLLIQYGYIKREAMITKYQAWIDYYNERIEWLIQNEANLVANIQPLKIQNNFLTSIFDSPLEVT